MRRVAIRHDASTYMHGRIVTDHNAPHEKRIRVALLSLISPIGHIKLLNLGNYPELAIAPIGIDLDNVMHQAGRSIRDGMYMHIVHTCALTLI